MIKYNNKYKGGEGVTESSKFDRIRDALIRFTSSYLYSLLLFSLACVFIFTGKEIIGTYIFAFVIAFTMILSDDLFPALEGLLAVTCFAIQCKYSFKGFMEIWPLGILPVAMFFAHFFLYKKKLNKTSFLPGMIAVSIAILAGGVGVIYWKSYFSPTSLFYMGLLGFGMVLICSYLASCFGEKKTDNADLRFCRMHITAIFIICAAIFWEYYTRFDEFYAAKSVIAFQWRNNAASILMLAMPFAFYLASRKFGWTAVGILDYILILLTGSRGGLIFGGAELALCFIVMTVIDKKHRVHNIILIAAGIILTAFAGRYLFEMISSTINRLFDADENTIRIELIRRGIADFKFNPINGRGLGYMGNRDIHHSARHTLCWYHNSIIQVIASFGILGVAAYSYLNILRIRTLIKNISFFNIILFISFIGIEMMSLVNPGVFAPFPYLFFVTVYFTAMEICGCGEIDTVKKMMRGTD
ncbi:MAG: O-antigen ligase family protein [Clostridia bacterium]|nr:O-antigen ligase family protein [Clostridia bacterium]